MTTKDEMQILRALVARHKTGRYGVLNAEAFQTVEAHTNRMLALASVVAEAVGLELNTDELNKLNALILVHDLGEFGLEHDVTVLEQDFEKGAKEKKAASEKANIARLAGEYGGFIADLWGEYERQGSEASRFVKWIDKYEANRHMLEIGLYAALYPQVDGEHVPFLANGRRLVAAANALPIMRDFTRAHFERELKVWFKRCGRVDLYEGLVRGLL